MQFKFLCLNLWQGGNLMEDILEFIKKENPDIIALQEVYNGANPVWDRKYRTMEVFSKELGYQFSEFAPAFLENKDFGKIEQGNAVFSKFPILNNEVTFFDVPYCERNEELENFEITPRNLQHVKIKLGEKILDLFNTQGIWGMDGKDSERRLKMGETIIEKIRDKENIILTGDFNLDINTKTIANIEQYLVNVFKGELKSTFNMLRKSNPGFATAVVDMVFISKNIIVKSKFCPNVDITDHLPLLVELEM